MPDLLARFDKASARRAQKKEKVKTYILATLCFFLGLGVVFGYTYLKSIPSSPVVTQGVPLQENPLQGSPEPTLALVPPSEALSGTLTITKGKVDMFLRTGKAFEEASTGAQILLGESVATKPNSTARVMIEGYVAATMDPLSELVFANMFPTNFVLQQKNGKIQYVVEKPISIRALHTLVSMQPGDATINIIDTDISVTVKTGSAKLAIVDNDNITHVYELNPGDRANIDDVASEVFLVKAK